MQQQVAQLLLDALHIVVGDGVGQLVRLLDGIAPQRIESLLAVPRTLAAQRVHHFEQTGRSLQSFIFHAQLHGNGCSGSGVGLSA